MTLRIRVRAPVKPTEDPARVRDAILALFPGATVEEADGALHARAPDGERLKELVRSQRIPDSARGAILAGLSDDGLHARFLLGKQAAAAGRAHFGPLRSPLGDLEVEIEGSTPDEVEGFVYHIAPDTTVPLEMAEIPPRLRPGEPHGKGRAE